MKRNLILLFLLLCTVTAKAQGVQKNDLIGNWKVSKVEMIKENKTLMVADEDTVHFSESFVNSLKEEEKKMTFALMNAMMKLALETKLILSEDGTVIQVNHDEKEFKGTYVLGKGGKKLTTVFGEKKKEY